MLSNGALRLRHDGERVRIGPLELVRRGEVPLELGARLLVAGVRLDLPRQAAQPVDLVDARTQLARLGEAGVARRHALQAALGLVIVAEIELRLRELHRVLRRIGSARRDVLDLLVERLAQLGVGGVLGELPGHLVERDGAVLVLDRLDRGIADHEDRHEEEQEQRLETALMKELVDEGEDEDEEQHDAQNQQDHLAEIEPVGHPPHLRHRRCTTDEMSPAKEMPPRKQLLSLKPETPPIGPPSAGGAPPRFSGLGADAGDEQGLRLATAYDQSFGR